MVMDIPSVPVIVIMDLLVQKIWMAMVLVCTQDCDDTEPLAYPGAAYLDSETLCLKDADGDNRGDVQPSIGIFQERIVDDDPYTYNGAATNQQHNVVPMQMVMDMVPMPI